MNIFSFLTCNALSMHGVQISQALSRRTLGFIEKHRLLFNDALNEVYTTLEVSECMSMAHWWNDTDRVNQN
jgi:hypothetical protein